MTKQSAKAWAQRGTQLLANSCFAALAMTACVVPTQQADDAGEPTDSNSEGVVGGTEVRSDRAFPAAMAVYRNFPGYGWFQICGAVLVRRDWALMAGHCVAWRDPDPEVIRVLDPAELALGIGSIDIRTYEAVLAAGGPDGRQVIGATAVHLHPRYHEHVDDPGFLGVIDALSNDVAVVKLARQVRAEPAAFVTSEREEARVAAPGSFVQAIGWGATDVEGTVYPNILNRVTLQVPTRSNCAAAYSSRYDLDVIGPSHFCAGGGSRDTCFGDSGGPLFGFRNGERVVVGLTSFGDDSECAVPGLPGAYSRMATLGRWVAQCLRDEARCDAR